MTLGRRNSLLKSARSPRAITRTGAAELAEALQGAVVGKVQVTKTTGKVKMGVGEVTARGLPGK